MCASTVIAVYHKRNVINNRNALSQFWRLEFQGQGIGKAVFVVVIFLKPVRKNLLHDSLIASDICLALLMIEESPRSLPSSSHVFISVYVFV